MLGDYAWSFTQILKMATKKYRFEIQSCISVEIEAENKEDARMKIVNNLRDYGDEMTDGSCYVSDGDEI